MDESESGPEPSGSGQQKSKAPPDKEDEEEPSNLASSNNCNTTFQKHIDTSLLPGGRESVSNTRTDSTSSPGRSSPESVCAVCLGPFQDKSFADNCFHPFCFNCLVEWSKVKAECPLCKQTFSSIVHNVRSMEDYDQYYIVSKSSQSSWHSADGRRFRYSSTLTSERLVERQTFNVEFDRQTEFARHRLLYAPHSFRTNAPMPAIMFPETRVSSIRQNIYQTGLWSETPKGKVKVRSTSPSFYQENPACTHRLIPWLNRELFALLHGSETRVMFVLDLILSLIMRYEIRSEEFHLHLEPYLANQTRHFVHEFFNYASSPLDMPNYDQSVTYERLSQCDDTIILSSPGSDVVQVSSSDTSRPTTSSTSIPRKKKSKKRAKRLTKLYLKRDHENNSWDVLHSLPSTATHDTMTYVYPGCSRYISFPSGPSTSHSCSTVLVPSSPSIEIDNSSDECEIVECVKPQSLRTHEIIDLISDGEDAVPPEDNQNILDAANGLISLAEAIASTSQDLSEKESKEIQKSSDDNNFAPSSDMSQKDSSNGNNNSDTGNVYYSSMSAGGNYSDQWSSLQNIRRLEVSMPAYASSFWDRYNDSTDISDCEANAAMSQKEEKESKDKSLKLNSVVNNVSAEYLNSSVSSSQSSHKKKHKMKHKKKKHEKHKHKHHKSRSHSKDIK